MERVFNFNPGGVPDRTVGVGQQQHGHSGHEQHDQRQNRLAIGIRRSPRQSRTGPDRSTRCRARRFRRARRTTLRGPRESSARTATATAPANLPARSRSPRPSPRPARRSAASRTRRRSSRSRSPATGGSRGWCRLTAAMRAKRCAPKNATNWIIRTRPTRNDWSSGRPRATNSSCDRNSDAIEMTVWMPSLNSM